ncbi:adhesion G protein-coupled receptor L2-like [Anneissia japonica]|uniref:adhesion G protein-coupled receptor L2-like n=1 Tax=Anneissia japonica TaxID=1529436 RepID=UPI0014257F8B|nr:adhesion G protein-coupled receptor L2-like [Anneissia japonica]
MSIDFQLSTSGILDLGTLELCLEIICGGIDGTLNCTRCHLIHVLSATWGRHEDESVCTHPWIHTTDCGEWDNALEVTAGHCNNRSTCSLSPGRSLFGYDPCENTHKYLEIDFECIQGCSSDDGSSNCNKPNKVMEYFKEFDGCVLSNLNHIKGLQTKIEYFNERNYVGIAKIISTDGIQWVSNSLQLVDGTKIEFDLQVQMKGDVLLVATFTNHTIETNEAVNDTVVIGGVDSTDEYRYLTELFMCNVYDIVNISRLEAKLNFSIFQKMETYTENEAVDKEPTCLFFNETQKTWSDEGVITTDHSQDKVSCFSDHITSFSVLMKVTKAEGNKTLSLISGVCVSLSLIALVVSLIVYCLFLELWKSLRVSIHKNLVVNMILMQSLFIFGIDKTGHKIGCAVVSVLLHFTALNTFTWMFGEAVYLLFKVSTSAPSQHNQLRNYMAVCYGIPLIIVAISSAGIPSGHNHDDICWLGQERGMIWAFVAPAISIAMVNTGIMCIVLRIIYKRAGNMVGKPAAERTKFKQLRKTTRATIMLLPLMGTTWLFGPFAANFDTVFLDYVFNLLNGCQGIFIFLIYCVFDNETKECFKKRFKKNEVIPQTEMTQNQ